MKLLHRPDLYGWSTFDEARNIDFNSILWQRRYQGEAANVVIDPLPMTEHDWQHLESLGGVKTIIVTNSDHVRDTAVLRARTGATVFGPVAEASTFPMDCEKWLSAGDEPVAGLVVHAMSGSKTPGELALVLEGTTLITGDLIRAHAGGRLDLLPKAKLANPAQALESVRELLQVRSLSAVLPGDGWPAFYDAHRLLEELIARLESNPS